MAIPAAPYQSPVGGSLEALYVAIETLEKQVRDLTSRLEPVLGLSVPRPCETSTDESAGCSLCDTIDSRSRQVRLITGVVVDALDRLKL
jgi:hypothetical protein